MTENEKVVLIIETEQRTKSNTHQINEIKADIKDIKEENKVLYKLATSVEVIANNIDSMKTDMSEVKLDVSDLKKDVANVKQQDSVKKAKRLDDIWDKIIWLIVGGLGAYMVSQLISNVFTK